MIWAQIRRSGLRTFPQVVGSVLRAPCMAPRGQVGGSYLCAAPLMGNCPEFTLSADETAEFNPDCGGTGTASLDVTGRMRSL